MAVSRQTVAQTFADVIAWRPVLEPVLRAFEPILTAQAELADSLMEGVCLSGPALPELDVIRAQQGVSLLSGASLAGISAPMLTSAERLLPLLEKLEMVAPQIPALSTYFLGQSKTDARHDALAEAMVAGNRDAVARIAKDNGLDAIMLEFVAGFILQPVLRAMVAQARSGEKQAPWNEGNIWQQGYCPVCGALPSVGWLDKPMVDDKNTFLAGGGGKKHLHCGQCGADWLFRRGTCPSCGEEGSGVIEILHESGLSHGERLDWCTRCKTYCPTVDLREREFVPDMDAAAMGMMHLDMVAARKALRPLKPSFWNIF